MGVGLDAACHARYAYVHAYVGATLVSISKYFVIIMIAYLIEPRNVVGVPSDDVHA